MKKIKKAKNRNRLIMVLMIAMLFMVSACTKKEETPEPTVPDASETQETETPKVMVVYFSYTGNTKKLAEYIAGQCNGDLYEIKAADPYTEDDTRYDADTRAYKEQHDPACRPEIEGELPDLSGYDTVFIGYPIWHGEAPMICYTFLENVDVDGKRIIPFCTSAESPVGSSAENLATLKPEAEWDEGIRLEIEMSEEEIAEWLETLDLSE